MIIRQHYVLASSGEGACSLASLIDAGRLPPMARTAPELLALLRLHPGCYRPALRAFRVFTGLARSEFKLLDCIENVR